jgi:hypothetical protein
VDWFAANPLSEEKTTLAIADWKKDFLKSSMCEHSLSPESNPVAGGSSGYLTASIWRWCHPATITSRLCDLAVVPPCQDNVAPRRDTCSDSSREWACINIMCAALMIDCD